MAVAFGWANDAGNGFVAANTTLTTSKGANSINSGDLLIVMVIVEANVGAITPAAGFTLLDSQRVDANNLTTAFFYKVAGGSETGSYVFSWTGSNFFAWSLINITGASGTPIDQVATNTVASSTNFTTASITPTGSADFLVTIFVDDGTAFTAPSGMTTNVNNINMESGTCNYMVTSLQLASNSSVSKTATVGAAKSGSTLILAITPSGGSVSVIRPPYPMAPVLPWVIN